MVQIQEHNQPKINLEQQNSEEEHDLLEQDLNNQETTKQSNTVETEDREARQTFMKKFGISFSKGEMLDSTPQEQAAYVLSSESKTVQFLVTKERSVQDYLPVIAELRENNPDISVSVHASSPKLNDEAKVVNKEDELIKSNVALAEVGCNSLTIHPGSIEMSDWLKASAELHESAINALAGYYARTIAAAKERGKSLTVAIENLPAKGMTGNWGQTPEELGLLIEQTRQILIKNFSFTADETINCVGITMDIGHALSGVAPEKRLETLNDWFKKLSSDIKCFHVPNESNDEVASLIMETLRQLCDKYQISPEIYLESKKSLSDTKAAFAGIRNKILSL